MVFWWEQFPYHVDYCTHMRYLWMYNELHLSWYIVPLMMPYMVLSGKPISSEWITFAEALRVYFFFTSTNNGTNGSIDKVQNTNFHSLWLFCRFGSRLIQFNCILFVNKDKLFSSLYWTVKPNQWQGSTYLTNTNRPAIATNKHGYCHFIYVTLARNHITAGWKSLVSNAFKMIFMMIHLIIFLHLIIIFHWQYMDIVFWWWWWWWLI